MVSRGKRVSDKAATAAKRTASVSLPSACSIVHATTRRQAQPPPPPPPPDDEVVVVVVEVVVAMTSCCQSMVSINMRCTWPCKAAYETAPLPPAATAEPSICTETSPCSVVVAVALVLLPTAPAVADDGTACPACKATRATTWVHPRRTDADPIAGTRTPTVRLVPRTAEAGRPSGRVEACQYRRTRVCVVVCMFVCDVMCCVETSMYYHERKSLGTARHDGRRRRRRRRTTYLWIHGRGNLFRQGRPRGQLGRAIVIIIITINTSRHSNVDVVITCRRCPCRRHGVVGWWVRTLHGNMM